MVGALGQDWPLPAFLARCSAARCSSGGAVSVIGAVLGTVFVDVITSGLYMLEISEFWIQTALGVVLLAATCWSAVARHWRWRGRAAMDPFQRFLRADLLGLAVLILVGGAALSIARPEFSRPTTST